MCMLAGTTNRNVRGAEDEALSVRICIGMLDENHARECFKRKSKARSGHEPKFHFTLRVRYPL